MHMVSLPARIINRERKNGYADFRSARGVGMHMQCQWSYSFFPAPIIKNREHVCHHSYCHYSFHVLSRDVIKRKLSPPRKPAQTSTHSRSTVHSGMGHRVLYDVVPASIRTQHKNRRGPATTPVLGRPAQTVHPFHCGWCTPRSAKLGFGPRTALDGPAATRAGAVRGAFWLGPGWGNLAVRLGVRGEFST